MELRASGMFGIGDSPVPQTYVGSLQIHVIRNSHSGVLSQGIVSILPIK